MTTMNPLPLQDRTQDFFSLASKHKGQTTHPREQPKYTDELNEIRNPKVKQTVIVNRMAQEITRDIDVTARKLQSLAERR